MPAMGRTARIQQSDSEWCAMPNNRSIWLIVLSTVLFFGAAFVTLRAAEQAIRPAAGTQPAGTLQTLDGPQPAGGAQPPARPRGSSPPTHPPASAPEESA